MEGGDFVSEEQPDNIKKKLEEKVFGYMTAYDVSGRMMGFYLSLAILDHLRTKPGIELRDNLLSPPAADCISAANSFFREQLLPALAFVSSSSQREEEGLADLLSFSIKLFTDSFQR
ncbi:MAG: hypothetical protein A2571_01035 [Candidatus Vogelbacteria bacterium RIFOXYD1_FULL_44_32]|uniref:Uncharacterized protein n=1 Tax=Candidatus Vogelbacteria bacterium RIFOXYD1_FULL_44_32 TaxID=1802438 RepID=A0A1G2QEU6_9BACT|nr:MAG: hypothetical protein A2571_01035 [Candidatus Vogelbacteria bacterium RIFOXYD1_FULL_44_32]